MTKQLCTPPCPLHICAEMSKQGMCSLHPEGSLTSNLVSRLREKAAKGGVIPIHDVTIEEAASEIEKLGHELKETRRSLDFWKSETIAGNTVVRQLREALEKILPLRGPGGDIALAVLHSTRDKLSVGRFPDETKVSDLHDRFARAYNRLQCADVPRGPWHTEVGDYLLFGDSLVESAAHASAPSGCKCADCSIDGEACPACYAVWWSKRHPNVTFHGGSAVETEAPPPLCDCDPDFGCKEYDPKVYRCCQAEMERKSAAEKAPGDPS